MRRRSLLAATTAALTLTVTLGLGAVACGSARMAALHANCTTKSLRWKLTVLKKVPRSAHREARLSVVNKGAQPCVFHGFPYLMVHVGKGPESDGKGQGPAMPIDLQRGATVTTSLRYRDSYPGRPSETCLVSNDTAEVSAPRDRAGRLIPVRDERGKRSRMDICDHTIWMSPPRQVAE
ncbi:DUF4232 domain-containing protein [Streptomyces chattanoogensis]|uniref:DUF4232 domain-containing protein n=1 Tax=Streptomyces chattanoogensis TaxID=66876 RepID=UPI0006B531E4|nr:DUF4232 domain-containing protein [Streptomyces chattanoogensis]